MRRKKGERVVKVTVRLDDGVHSWLEDLARREDRTLNVQINRLLRQLKEREERGEAPERSA